MNTHDNKPDGKIYELRTLADIYKLPSIEHIRRCLSEVCEVVLTTRAATDALIAAVKETSPELAVTIPSEAVEFPEVLHWCDDGNGSIELNFDHDGRTLLTISNRPDAK